MNHKPATALPWDYYRARKRGMADRATLHSPHYDKPGVISGQGSLGEICGGDAGRVGSNQNAAYIAHAANAYPRLVEALRECEQQLIDTSGRIGEVMAKQHARTLLRELGEDA